MEKPKKVTPVAIQSVHERAVCLWANAPDAERLRELGNLSRVNDNLWYLSVDGRYVFADVLAYIESLDTSLDTLMNGDAG